MTDRKQDQAWVEATRAKYRDASTGAYVTREYADANPATTVKESDGRVAELMVRIEALEAQVMALTARVQGL